MPTENTRTRILKYVLSEELSALDLSDKIGINESAVRRHLNILEEKDLIEHYFKKAGRGRPKKLFKITSTGKELFPRKTGVLLEIILKKMREKLERSELEALMKEVAEELKTYFPPVKEEEAIENRLKSVVNAFNEFGFFASLSKENDAYVIEYRNCVFGKAAEEVGNSLCKIHLQILQDLIGNLKIQQEGTLLGRGNICRHKIKKAKE